jgi:hypothetical protein
MIDGVIPKERNPSRKLRKMMMEPKSRMSKMQILKISCSMLGGLPRKP